MNGWIKIGPCLYNLDKAQHIDLGAIVPRAHGDEPGVRIYFGPQDGATFTAAEADAVRRYVNELVAQRKVPDLSVVPAPVSTADSVKEVGG